MAREHFAVGEQGYDATRVPEMKAIFFAAGPGHSPWSCIGALREREPLSAHRLDSRSRYHEPETGPVDGKLRVLDRSLTATRVIFLAAAQNALGNCFHSQASERTGIPNPTETSRNT